jgi:TonB-dependent starch-binding outer membrane protein SusC
MNPKCKVMLLTAKPVFLFSPGDTPKLTNGPANKKRGKKLFLSMKLTAIFMIAAALTASAGGYSQQVTISVKNKPLEKVFSIIEKQTGYYFAYTRETLAGSNPVSIEGSNISLKDILQLCFKEQPLTYVITDKVISVKRKAFSAATKTLADQETPLADGVVKGKVTNQAGEPLSGATIELRGTSYKTTTDAAGNFELSVPPGSYTVVITYVGYEIASQKIAVKDASTNSIATSLKIKQNALDNIVVVGYGTSKKKDVTGSVASVDISEQEKTPIIGTEQLIQGQVSGVQVIQSQSQPGGAVFSIRIRGTNSINSGSEPLFVVDGYAGADIAAINPSDVASIDVLKDASATAIYGSRGANGVVIITTKRGRYAGGSNISVNAYTGVQKVSKKYQMMDASQYATYLNLVQTEINAINGTNDPLPYTTSQISALGKGTDWQEEIFRNAPISNAAIAFSSGDEKSRQYLSFNYFQQQGIIIGSDYKRGIIRYNTDRNITKKLLFSFSSQMSYDYQNAIPVNTYGASGTASVLWDAVRYNPANAPKDANGAYTFQNTPQPFVEPLGNPVAYATKSQDANFGFKTFINTFVEYELLKGLKLKSSFGVNFANLGSKFFVPSTLYTGAISGGTARQVAAKNIDWLTEHTISYAKEIKKHSFNTVGGFTFQRARNNFFDATTTNLVTNNLGPNGLALGTNLSNSFLGENTLASFFARVNYQYNNRYLLTATMRADGSSRFGENNKWGYFPSGAVAWRVSEENFMKNVKSVSDLKLRVSYGVTGNQEIGNYNTLATYGNDPFFNTLTNYLIGQTPVLAVGVASQRIPNPNLKWESTTSTNIGFDLGLFNNRVSLTADYYRKKTNNLLLFKGVPLTSGFSSVLENIGAVENKGFEFMLTTRNINTTNFKWTSRFNFSKNNNKVLDLGPNSEIYVGEISNSIFVASPKSSILRVGQPIGSFFGYVFDGIWQSQAEITASGTTMPVLPGDPRYKDVNDDKVVDDNDRVILGNAVPKFVYAFDNEIQYKAFTLNFFFQGVYGNKVLNVNRLDIESGNTGYNKLVAVNNSWTGPNTSNTLPRVSSTLRRGTGITSDVVESGSFLRLKSVNLSYDLFSNRKVKGIKSASVYVTLQNLLTITNYTGYDPEVNSFGKSEALSLGTDYNAYPNYRSYLLGVKFDF